MIEFNSTRLDNGLRLIHYKDSATKMVALNLMYNVGSKCETAERTGLAHFMEHLMFTGSANVPSYDGALQPAGGTNNAWTNCDFTNYYETLPAHNIETALWVESDRLLSLTLSDESVAVQRDVVIEEFKQHYINEPYGDLRHIMQSLAYTRHPYMWPTIGKTPEHIEQTTREEIIDFYNTHYSVDNLVMCIAGNIEWERAVELVEKWFGGIAPTGNRNLNIPVEPAQDQPRVLRVGRDVPQDVIYRTYHMPGRNQDGYPECDLLSDVLANGRSSRFQQNIMSRCGVFTELDAAVQGTVDPGLFLVRARLAPGVTFDLADEIIDNEINRLINEGISSHEHNKCLNKFHSAMLFDNMGYQEKATRLCEYEMLGDASMINGEIDRYRRTTPQSIADVAARLFDKNNSGTVYYGPQSE